MNRNTSDGSADEYEALGDSHQVMTEVLGLVEDLRQATLKLGDALIAGGLQAPEWRSPDARLVLLSDQFPDITVDELITRISEFSGLAPHWLHGGEEEITHFAQEVEILYGVVRSLRIQAQRLRMLPRRERSNWPLERALRYARTGTLLDLLLGALRDLESLAPYLVPLTAEEWQAESPPSPGRVSRDSPRSPRPVGRLRRTGQSSTAIPVVHSTSRFCRAACGNRWSRRVADPGASPAAPQVDLCSNGDNYAGLRYLTAVYGQSLRCR